MVDCQVCTCNKKFLGSFARRRVPITRSEQAFRNIIDETSVRHSKKVRLSKRGGWLCVGSCTFSSGLKFKSYKIATHGPQPRKLRIQRLFFVGSGLTLAFRRGLPRLQNCSTLLACLSQLWSCAGILVDCRISGNVCRAGASGSSFVLARTGQATLPWRSASVVSCWRSCL